MKGIKILKKESNKIRKYLIENNFLNLDFKSIIQDDYIIFPLKNKVDKLNYKIKEYNFEKKKKRNFKDEIREILNENEKKFLKTSFDVIGNIAILEIEDELISKEKEIAKIIMKHHKNIKTILKKNGIHDGIFRTQKLKFILGENTKETTHKENGIILKLNVEKVYYSPRSSTERKRILEQIKNKENILCLFSGCGPFPITFKKHKDVNITSIELNPDGIKYQKENMLLNKINFNIIEGDVNKIIPKINEKFDRIAMPLPKSAEDFLEITLSKVKKNTIIHLYDFLHENKIKEKQNLIKNKIKKIGFECEIKSIKAGQYAPREFRICHDIKIK